MEHVVIRHILSGLFSFTLAFCLIPLMSRLAKRWDILDHPDGSIKIHKVAVPYLGGLAIYISFIVSLIIFYPLKNILWLIIGVSLLLILGLLDDLKVFSPFKKFLGQLVAVACFLKGGITLKESFFSTGFNTFASGFWMLLVINAFNLVDVMDGLSSILSITASLSFFIIALLLGNYSLSILLLIFVAPILAFFYFNKPPAKIYLGDSGALFIGGFLAAIPLFFSWSINAIYGFLVPIIILGLPLLEVSTLILIRTFKKIPFYQGSPHHYSIYLRSRGWSDVQVLVFSLVASVFLSTVAILFFLGTLSFKSICILATFFLLFWLYLIFYL
ncbi:undecaprenyl/decaprenyl-phosphate alpha-N-acetylglucosaminyl 1-phosphate transferase [Candidatus Babeliales bacterium]|nr:undecaprenyl/decaprenyl-phosphate alpha-N-acetylglucosaminyl 1-phosphate transferase [Candidatus Babeliales bacterium]